MSRSSPLKKMTLSVINYTPANDKEARKALYVINDLGLKDKLISIYTERRTYDSIRGLFGTSLVMRIIYGIFRKKSMK